LAMLVTSSRRETGTCGADMLPRNKDDLIDWASLMCSFENGVPGFQAAWVFQHHYPCVICDTSWLHFLVIPTVICLSSEPSLILFGNVLYHSDVKNYSEVLPLQVLLSVWRM
jgi:hypothetical protein